MQRRGTLGHASDEGVAPSPVFARVAHLAQHGGYTRHPLAQDGKVFFESVGALVILSDRQQGAVLVDDGSGLGEELRALPLEFRDVAQQIGQALLGPFDHAFSVKFSSSDDDVGFLLGGAFDFFGHLLGGDHRILEGILTAAIVLKQASSGTLVLAQVVVVAHELFHLGGDEVQECVYLGLVEATAEAAAETLLLDVERSQAHMAPYGASSSQWKLLVTPAHLKSTTWWDIDPAHPDSTALSRPRSTVPMTYENLLVEDDGAVRVITVNRPAALNALNRATVMELGQAFAAVAANASVRAVIITGSGDKSFVAGADITEFNTLSAEEARAYSQQGQGILDMLGQLDVPVIAAVNGFALGGGLELALACDFIYAADTARLGLVEVNLGIIPGFGGVARLARRVGTAMAAELILSASQVKADEALRIGLANKVVALAELVGAAKKTALTMAQKGPLATAAVKRLLREGEGAALSTANSLEQSAFGLVFSTEDRQIGVDAFLAKVKGPVPFVRR